MITDEQLSEIKEPSKLIRIALEDLTWVEKNEKYEINMGVWHTPFTKSKCAVCFAGAVMARSLGADINKSLSGSEFKSTHQFDALECLRNGNVQSAFNFLNYDDKEPRKYDRQITSYHTNKLQFKKDMDKLADDLEQDGF